MSEIERWSFSERNGMTMVRGTGGDTAMEVQPVVEALFSEIHKIGDGERTCVEE